MPLLVSADLLGVGKENKMFVLGNQDCDLIERCLAEQRDFTIHVHFAEDERTRQMFLPAGIARVVVDEPQTP